MRVIDFKKLSDNSMHALELPLLLARATHTSRQTMRNKPLVPLSVIAERLPAMKENTPGALPGMSMNGIMYLCHQSRLYLRCTADSSDRAEKENIHAGHDSVELLMEIISPWAELQGQAMDVGVVCAELLGLTSQWIRQKVRII